MIRRITNLNTHQPTRANKNFGLALCQDVLKIKRILMVSDLK